MKNFNTQVKPGKSYLFVFPHPDDETYSCAGFIQKLIKIGAKVTVLCLSKGDASTLRYGLNDKSLAEARKNEFYSVMKALKVNSFEISDFPDGKIEEVNIKTYLENQIIKFKPDYLITYEPNGIYGHPDHIYVSKEITDLGKQHDIKVIYFTIPSYFTINKNLLKMAKNPETVKPITPNYFLDLTFQEYFTKLNALFKYKTQISLFNLTLSQLLHLLMLKREFYFIRD